MNVRWVVSACFLFLLVLGVLFVLDGLSSGDEAVAEVDFKNIVGNQSAPAGEMVRTALRIAVSSHFTPQRARRYYKDLFELIGVRAGYPVVFSQKQTAGEILDMFSCRALDAAFVNPAVYVEGSRSFGLELLAVPVVNGQRFSCAYTIVHSDSDIHTFKDLQNRVFAFTSPHSCFGCLVPCWYVSQYGSAPDAFFGETFFTYSHENAIKAVADGLADGACVDATVWNFLSREEPDFTMRTSVIDQSFPCGSAPFVVHPFLEPALKERLARILFSLHKEKAAAGMLKELSIDYFDRPDDLLYDPVRRIENL